ncbi:glycosyltransferase family 4 protein [Phormidium tenue FACHB-886]|nr:glycosyltransferase family 4 protein [Phormidium tenue FACHB-886]
MNVLLSAYACEPGKGSEPGVGWSVAQEIAKYHSVWVLTSETHRDGIEAELAQRPIANLHIVYLDPLGWVYDWTQEGKRPHWDVHLHYYLWQLKAYSVAKQLHSQVQFDVVHHVTYVKYSSPSFLALLPIPFVWGSVGGGESAPAAFWRDFGLRGKVYETLRNASRWLGELDPFVRLTARRSHLTFATTEDTARRLRSLGAENVQVLPAIGLSDAELEQLDQSLVLPATPGKIRFISMARLLHWKGLHLALQAFAKAELSEAEYWIVGEGPERDRLQALAEELGVAHQVKFWGRLPRHETLLKLKESQVLLHPSLHESGGLVCLEAMASRHPVICLDLGGPAVQVTAKTGFKIPAESPDQVAVDLAKAMLHLAKDTELLRQMGEAARQQVCDRFAWTAKGKMFAQLYQDLASKPSSVKELTKQPSSF